MEEDLWYMQQQSRVLQDFRLSIRGLWDDAAAKRINLHLLDQHEIDDEEMVQGFVEQHQNLNECTVRRLATMEEVVKAGEISQKVNEFIEHTTEEVERAYQFYQQYRTFLAEAKGLLPEIDELVNLANSVGKGAPPYEP